MRVGILTYHRAKNYGAFLQAYGLCGRLNKEPDISAEIIDFHMTIEAEKYSLSRGLLRDIRHLRCFLYKKRLYSAFDRSLNQLPLSKEYCQSNSIDDFQEFVRGKYDVIIAGSDEIWKTDSFRGFPTPYWLAGNLGCYKLSYAASSRSDLSKCSPDERGTMKKILDSFEYISVRDLKTRDQFEKYIRTRTEIGIFPDPSFIYDYQADGNRGREHLIKIANLNPQKKIALVMTENRKIASLIQKELSEDYQLVASFERHNCMKNVADLTPFEWLDAIAGVDYVFASYFHAICFSILYNVPFLAFGTAGKKSKLEDILIQSGDIERYIEVDSSMLKECALTEAAKIHSARSDHSDYLTGCKKRFDEYLRILRSTVV